METKCETADGGAGGERVRRGAAPAAPAARSLESNQNTVTENTSETALGSSWFRLVKCRCDCWFCSDCCAVKARTIRAQLVPILETFEGILMVTLTVDPLLFETPKAAYLYMLDQRCVGRTLQDLHRAGYLHSRRYFGVVEWQMKTTEQAHFHLLLDANFIPFEKLLASWSKHRPPFAGQVEGERPTFGTAWISKPKFENTLHAANYATKYLSKFPEKGFPAWVLSMGKDRRIRRYTTSRGFWGRKSPRHHRPETKRQVENRSYAERVAECGKSTNLVFDTEEYTFGCAVVGLIRKWVCEVDLNANVIDELTVPGCEKQRGVLEAETVTGAIQEIARRLNRPVKVIRSGVLNGNRIA